ncbi:MAG: hypothetical protein SGCHY_003530, partial [Lobulomycetales sp.]
MSRIVHESLQETDQQIQTGLQDLRVVIAESDILSKLGPVDMTDAFLLRFLRSQKYRMPDSLA